jgi:hypothetical protein
VAQDRKITALYQATEPAIGEVPGLVDDAQPLLRQAVPVLAEVLAAGRDVGDVASRLPLLAAGIQGLTNEGIPLARGLNDADLPALVSDLRASDVPALVASLQASDIPAAIASADQVLTGLTSGDRLNEALDQATALLSEVSSRELPRRAQASARRLEELLEIQRRTFHTQREALRVQKRSLKHIRSIDRKTGGELPPPALTAPGSG